MLVRMRARTVHVSTPSCSECLGGLPRRFQLATCLGEIRARTPHFAAVWALGGDFLAILWKDPRPKAAAQIGPSLITIAPACRGPRRVHLAQRLSTPVCCWRASPWRKSPGAGLSASRPAGAAGFHWRRAGRPRGIAQTPSPNSQSPKADTRELNNRPNSEPEYPTIAQSSKTPRKEGVRLSKQHS